MSFYVWHHNPSSKTHQVHVEMQLKIKQRSIKCSCRNATEDQVAEQDVGLVLPHPTPPQKLTFLWDTNESVGIFIHIHFLQTWVILMILPFWKKLWKNTTRKKKKNGLYVSLWKPYNWRSTNSMIDWIRLHRLVFCSAKALCLEPNLLGDSSSRYHPGETATKWRQISTN